MCASSAASPNATNFCGLVEVSSLLRTGKLGLGEKEAISLAEKHKALLLKGVVADR